MWRLWSQRIRVVRQACTSRWCGTRTGRCGQLSPRIPLQPGVLKDLITGSGPHVRLYAAANSSLTQALADRLLADPDPYVRAVAATHPAASSAGLQRLAQDMSQPAWVLRAAAGNPACAQDLADQLLTWIALGGPGPSDPLFDPLECEGHPGDTRSASHAWYLEQARGPDAHRHPLWRVRASVMAGQGRISGEQARALARDPRPEVRRSIAVAAQLPLALRRELADDVNPQVARVAAAAVARDIKAHMQRRNQRAFRTLAAVLVWLLAPLGVVLSILTQQMGQSGSGHASGAGRQSGSAASTAGAGLAESQPTNVQVLPGGGVVLCGSASNAHEEWFSVFAGSKELTLRSSRGDLVRASGGPVLHVVTVPVGGDATFRLAPAASPVSVVAGAGGAAAVAPDVLRCGR